jgi:uncharacterized membrane protein
MNAIDPIQLIQTAWERFKTNPLLFIGMWVVYALLQPGGGGLNFADPNIQQAVGDEVFLAIIVVGVGWSCFTLILGPILRGGYDLAMLRAYRGDESLAFGDLFAGFSKALPLFITALLFGMAVFAGMLLCIVPGIILALGLWPAFLLVMEDNLDPIEALKAAWALTSGHKLQLLILSLIVGLLNMAGFMACCIGVFVTGPLGQIAWVGAYDAMRNPATETTIEGSYGSGFEASPAG